MHFTLVRFSSNASLATHQSDLHTFLYLYPGLTLSLLVLLTTFLFYLVLFACNIELIAVHVIDGFLHCYLFSTFKQN